MNKSVELADLVLPEFGLPTVEPLIGAEIYRARLEALRARAAADGYDLFMVYADREHFANLTYLTGYDPRFEESLLILDVPAPDRKPLLLVGNEGVGYSGVSPIHDDLEVVLCQSFSLLGQDRSKGRFEDILKKAGVSDGKRVGVAGWKHFGPGETDTPQTWFEVPAYIVDTLRSLTGDPSRVLNANGIFMDCDNGLRTFNEVDQLARFEFVSTFGSQWIRNVLFGVRPGMTELEAAGLMQQNGLPLSCDTFLAAGERASLGMISPSMRRIERGDPFTSACGLWGSLNSRAGFIVENENELPDGIGDYVDKLVVPYFRAVAAWYELVGIGVEGGDLYAAAHEHIGDPFFGVGLNPGHLIHLDEWVNSPIYKDSKQQLRSGMAIQVDIIPATHSPYFTTNIEDGIALADEELRAAFAAQYPEAWTRIEQRRTFMRESLGITLKPEVLPFSNIPAYLPPYVLAPHKAIRLRA